MSESVHESKKYRYRMLEMSYPGNLILHLRVSLENLGYEWVAGNSITP